MNRVETTGHADRDATPGPRAASAPPSPDDSGEGEEDARTQRRKLAVVWLAAGGAVAFMVGASWYGVVRGGSVPPGGDMLGHAAAAEWLRTLPWWDWRGWSDWFYGGQAIGVNYPPLGHAWMRFTHPVHGQMAAVALGLLALLPWGTLRLARAVGYSPRRQRIAVGAVLVLTAASGNMHWALSGFHAVSTFFGSWPAMLAVVIGLFAAAWAARCTRPVVAGATTGVALLCNASVIPGVGAVCLALLATSGATFRQAARWAVTAGAATLAVSAWWLVPFLAGWESRLVRWEAALHQTWEWGGPFQVLVLTGLGTGAAWAARRSGPACRLAGAAAACLGATLLADWGEWLRPERWLGPAILVAAVACAGLAAKRPRTSAPPGRLRPVWGLHAALAVVVFVVLTHRLEVLPLAVGLFLLPLRSWAWTGALAWSAVLFWGGLWDITDERPEPPPETPLGVVAAQSGPHAEGLAQLDGLFHTTAGELSTCAWKQPWLTAASTGGRIRPLFGLYRDTSPAAEFIDIKLLILDGQFSEHNPGRPHWHEAWQDAGAPALSSPAAAEALGSRWYVECDEDDGFSVADMAGVTAGGVTVAPYPSESAWHRAAARWWISVSAGRVGPLESEPVPVLSRDGDPEAPAGRAATGVWMRADGDRLTVGADTAGWAWLRVPWDPYWSSPTGAAVRKGGPGHLVVWAPEGITELVWRVPAAVDATAAAVTGAAGLLVAAMAGVNRRSGFRPDLNRPRPAGSAIGLYADTVDGWLQAAADTARPRTKRRGRPPAEPDPPPTDAQENGANGTVG